MSTRSSLRAGLRLVDLHSITKCALVIAACLCAGSSARAIDLNGNGLDDVWEMIYGATGLDPNADTDHDGWTNAQECAAGTDPFDPKSHPTLSIAPWGTAKLQLAYPHIAGKRYRLQSKTDLSLPNWTPEFTEVAPDASGAAWLFDKPTGKKFWHLVVDDIDTDGDGLTDAEERWLHFDPTTDHSERNDSTDYARVTAGLNAANTVTLGVLQAFVNEQWPEPGVVVVRRSGGLKPLTVNLSFSGTATRDTVYFTNIAANTVFVPAGIREVPVLLNPKPGANDPNSSETIIVTLQNGTGYTVAAPTSGTVTLYNDTAASPPSTKAAARFLLQAAFGPDQAPPGSEIPSNIQPVLTLGFSGWIDDQFTRPVGLIQPWVDWATVNASPIGLYGNWKEYSWWGRAMGYPKLRPDATTTVTPDPLRQRIAFALSEILVASDRPETLAVEQQGVANFYDIFEQNAFGNYRDILQAVALHPVMGIFLSHLGNQQANPALHIYPDENFAREVMQLFSIGLWMLNPDGTRQLDGLGQPIPTYSNSDITELARVFTGLTYGSNTSFGSGPQDFTVPMKGWDAFHDCGSKVLVGGTQIPARTASLGNNGTATLADVTAALDNLFNHQNVGPFIALRLIQRLVTSNPSPAYVGRVAAAFANNGQGVRGDMKAVVKAILLDQEARDPAMMSQPTWGRMREPFLRCVNFAHAFNASSQSGYYPVSQFALAHLQDPMNSPTVFNFFLPTYSPAGPITQMGLVAPEFQIVNASSAVSGANYFWDHTLNDLNYYGEADPTRAVMLNLNDELAFIVPAAHVAENSPAGNLAMDPDPLIRRLDLALTGGTLSPAQHQIIREAMLRIDTSLWQWHRERFRMAVYLITTSPEFNILR